MFKRGTGRARSKPPSLSSGSHGISNSQSHSRSLGNSRDSSSPKRAPPVKSKRPKALKPLLKSKAGPICRPPTVREGEVDDVLYFAVLYTKRSRKKNKVFQDGFIRLQDDKVLTLMDEGGKQIARSNSSIPLGGLKEGNTLEVNSFELEIDLPVAAAEFTSGRVFLPAWNAPVSTNSEAPLVDGQLRSTVAASSSRAASLAFRAPRKSGGTVASSVPRVPKALHDPSCPDADVLQNSYMQGSGCRTVAIVLDPYLGRHMRPHQKEGVKFLYECVEGRNRKRGGPQGAVLGDEMGLGKSLQSIALMWTLLKQGPLGSPVAEKAIVVCPASLVGNWAAEIKKWLGDERLLPIQVQSGQSKSFKGFEPIQDFVHGKVRRALIISYEMFRSYADELYKCSCGILICDEGHRLKSSSGNKTIDALMRMPCRRRIILTGTPVQNNLGEFYAMCNFVNPGVFDDYQRFRNVFAGPIEKSRDASADDETIRLGEERAAELQRVTSQFVLRRTSETLENYLPPKTETVVFCRLSPKQETAYENLCSMFFSSLDGQRERMAPLPLINALRKLCCHPSMAANASHSHIEGSGAESNGHEKTSRIRKIEGPTGGSLPVFEALAERPQKLVDSGKLQIALSLSLAAVAAGDRVVLVSNFTSTLDVIQNFLDLRCLNHIRLDGSTPSALRSDLVKRFNSDPSGAPVFLLSAKAGGVGLNLIGANRLICFDPDWNPATDLQTMARVWRDGQKKPVFIYRLLGTGTIEEKIYQRQLFKGELQVAVGARKSCDSNVKRKPLSTSRSNGRSNTNFTAEELKDLFTYDKQVPYCDTLQVLENSKIVSEDEHGPAEAATLLKLFATHRDVVEAANMKTVAEGGIDLGREKFLPCGSDEVLSSVLNESDDSRGIVSYLFTTETGHPGVDTLQCDPSAHPPKPIDDAVAESGNICISEVLRKPDYKYDHGEKEFKSDDSIENQNIRHVLPHPASRKRYHQLAFAEDSDEHDSLVYGEGQGGRGGTGESTDKENIAPVSACWSAALCDLDAS